MTHIPAKVFVILLNAVEGLYQGPVIIHYACVI